MTEIHATDVATYEKTAWRVMRVMEPGISKMRTKAGEVDVPFAAGDVLLADGTGHVIVAPIGLDGAVKIATAVLDGDLRASSDSHSLRALATAVIGFRPQLQPDAAADPDACAKRWNGPDARYHRPRQIRGRRTRTEDAAAGLSRPRRRWPDDAEAGQIAIMEAIAADYREIAEAEEARGRLL